MSKLKKYIWAAIIVLGIPLWGAGIKVWVIAQTLPKDVIENKQVITETIEKSVSNYDRIWSHESRLNLLENEYKILNKHIDELKEEQQNSTKEILREIRRANKKENNP